MQTAVNPASLLANLQHNSYLQNQQHHHHHHQQQQQQQQQQQLHRNAVHPANYALLKTLPDKDTMPFPTHFPAHIPPLPPFLSQYLPPPTPQHPGMMDPCVPKKVTPFPAHFLSQTRLHYERLLATMRQPLPPTGPSLPPPHPHQPQMDPYSRGRLVKLADGELKALESLCLADFQRSERPNRIAAADLHMTEARVALIEVSHTDCTARIQLAPLHLRAKSTLSVPVSKPFFTKSSGWASVDPEACLRQHRLVTSKLSLDHICLCLVRKTPVLERAGDENNNSISKPASPLPPGPAPPSSSSSSSVDVKKPRTPHRFHPYQL